MSRQLTLLEILREDKYYRQWFQKPPVLKVFGTTLPWRLYVQKEEGGRWARADYDSFPKAYSALRLRLTEYHDAAIHSKRQAFAPPVLKISGKRYRMPMPDGHLWCSYCRRPTLFKYFSKHPALSYTNPEELRCLICGAREAGMKRYRSPLNWPLK